MSAHRHARRAGPPAGLTATAAWSTFAVVAAAATLVVVGGDPATALLVLIVGIAVVAVAYVVVRFGGVTLPIVDHNSVPTPTPVDPPIADDIGR